MDSYSDNSSVRSFNLSLTSSAVDAAFTLAATATSLSSTVENASMPLPASSSSLPATVDVRQHPPAVEENLFQFVHTTLTIAALATNCASLFVVYGVIDRLLAPLQLLTSLAFAEMLAPWAVMTLYFGGSGGGVCQDEIHTSVLLTAHNAAALSLGALAATHHAATFRPLQYSRLTSTRRVWAMALVVWVIAVVGAHIHVLFALDVVVGGGDGGSGGRAVYCERIRQLTGVALNFSAVVGTVVVVSAVTVYSCILVHLRPVEAFRQPASRCAVAAAASTDAETTSAAAAGQQPWTLPMVASTSSSSSSSPRSTRGVFTGIILFVGHVVAWAPYLAVKQVAHWNDDQDGGGGGGRSMREFRVAIGVCQALIIVVCAADPVVYGWRMSNMRLGYSRLGQRVRQCAAAGWTRCLRRLAAAAAGGARDETAPNTPLNHIDSVCY